MVAYYYNVLHNVDTAIMYNNKILELDPTNATSLQTKEALESVQKQQEEAASKASPAKKD
jgi:hypothetical protein